MVGDDAHLVCQVRWLWGKMGITSVAASSARVLMLPGFLMTRPDHASQVYFLVEMLTGGSPLQWAWRIRRCAGGKVKSGTPTELIVTARGGRK